MKKVQVLLSSYNGEKYIVDQLDSILRQTDVEVHCYIRDDGSTDNTLDILHKYQNNNKNIKVIKGVNIGYKASFMQLLEMSDEFEYYAFSDQDDIWMPNKLISAIKKIENSNKNVASLYCSNCTVVDESLNYIRNLHDNENIIPHKGKALVQGFAHGCTMVLNKKARDLVLKHPYKGDQPHDFWIPLLMIYLGQVIYDKNSYILYRQHTNNVFGSQKHWTRLVRHGINKFDKKKNISNTIKELLIGYSEYIFLDDRLMLEEICNYDKALKSKIRLLLNANIRRTTFRGTIFLKLLILFSRF